MLRKVFFFIVAQFVFFTVLVIGLSGTSAVMIAGYWFVTHHGAVAHPAVQKAQPRKVVPKGHFVRFTSVNGLSEKTSLCDGCLRKTRHPL